MALAQKYGSDFELASLCNEVSEAGKAVESVQKRAFKITDAAKIEDYNRFVMIVSRLTTNVFQTYSEKYQQDSYGYTKLSAMVPLLTDLEALNSLDKDSFEYGMVVTQLVKNKNRISDAMKQVKDFAYLYDKILKI